MTLYKKILLTCILMILAWGGCQKNPVGNNDEPLEFPDFPETPE